jgi:hypothetical protein
MADVLQKLFGSAPRVTLLRLFLFNPKLTFTTADLAHRTQLSDKNIRSELPSLVGIGLLKRNKRGKLIRYHVNEEFSYLLSLQNLLLNVSGRTDEVRERLRKTGTIKLIVITGMFVGEWDASLDLLVVGDRINDRAFKKHIRRLESEIGKDIRYVLMPSADFFYRLNISDKLMRDTFDYPHRIIFDRLDIGLK